jgi:hypothetical protein
MKHLQYLWYLLRHKWFVFYAGMFVTHAPFWRLVVHDWSKFMPSEWFPYVEKFYGDWRTRAEKLPEDDQMLAAFDRAWLHHIHLNAHHWQHWILREDDGATKVLQVPDAFLREMVADWMGAGRAITGKWEAKSWYQRNKHKIQLHRFSQGVAEALLDIGELKNGRS